ncbi:MAG: LapA family protein [Firmicutes bacterium]|nr:LapA family protein [Bacillota bacterium]
MQKYAMFGLILATIIAVFALQNSEPVTVKFLFWQLPDLPLVIIILVANLLGSVSMFLFSLGKQVKMSLTIRELQSRIKELGQPAEKKETRQAGESVSPKDGEASV